MLENEKSIITFNGYSRKGSIKYNKQKLNYNWNDTLNDLVIRIIVFKNPNLRNNTLLKSWTFKYNLKIKNFILR